MKDWYSSIYKACIIASLIAFIIGFFVSSENALGAYIAGYSVLTLGVMMILIILFNNVLRVSSNDSTVQILYSILLTTGPFILMLAVIAFVLYLLINYKDNITAGHVAPSYNSFSNIIVLLLLLQVYLVYTNITTDKFETSGKISNVTSSIIYLLGILTAICSIILNTILKYYSTDGFTHMNL
jgi:lysylphosphatidylglycerol synthetase-like protein (DUF2156 family)